MTIDERPEPPPSEEMRLKAQAHDDLNDILALKRNKPFARYFMREPAEKIAELTLKLRDRRMSAEDRNYVVGQLETWERIAGKLAADESGNRSILDLPVE